MSEDTEIKMTNDEFDRAMTIQLIMQKGMSSGGPGFQVTEEDIQKAEPSARSPREVNRE
jgi:hypothetical protein